MVILATSGVCLLVIFYQYARAETLRRELAAFRRQSTTLHSEIKSMEHTIEVLAFEQQIALRKSLSRIKNFGHPDAKLIKFTETLIEGLVNVATQSATGHTNVAEVFKKYLTKTTDISFEDFNSFISSQPDKIKTHWHNKNINSYIMVCQQLLDILNGSSTQSAEA